MINIVCSNSWNVKTHYSKSDSFFLFWVQTTTAWTIQNSQDKSQTDRQWNDIFSLALGPKRRDNFWRWSLLPKKPKWTKTVVRRWRSRRNTQYRGSRATCNWGSYFWRWSRRHHRWKTRVKLFKTEELNRQCWKRDQGFFFWWICFRGSEWKIIVASDSPGTSMIWSMMMLVSQIYAVDGHIADLSKSSFRKLGRVQCPWDELVDLMLVLQKDVVDDLFAAVLT